MLEISILSLFNIVIPFVFFYMYVYLNVECQVYSCSQDSRIKDSKCLLSYAQ